MAGKRGSKRKAAKKVSVPVKGESRLALFAKQAIKQFGAGAIMTADQVDALTVPRVPTGIWVLDKALGGGFPMGRMSMIFGEESTGKSTIYARAVGMAQRMCGNCYRICELSPGVVERIDPNSGEVEEVESMVIAECQCGRPRNMVVAWIDQEGTYKSDWAASHGVFEERMLMSRPELAEEAVDIIDALLKSGLVDIVILDSVAEMIPMKESEMSAVDSQDMVGVHAKIMNSALRKWNQGLNKMFRLRLSGEDVNVPSVWLVNQTRQKPGVSFGSPETTPGGFGQRFFPSVAIRTRKLSYKTPEDGSPRKTVLLDTHWVELGFKITKNKVSAAQQAGTYRICLMDIGPFRVGDILDHDDVLFYALKYGVVNQISDKKYECGGEEYLGKSGVTDRWAADRELYEVIKRRTLDLALGLNVDE